jgi:F-type H+-transporting ATPase subunit beta
VGTDQISVSHDNKKLSVNIGKVVSVRGSVVDAWFDSALPDIYTMLHTGKDKQVAIEIMEQLDAHRVRGIALTPTQGLARGMLVESENEPLKVPVGKETLGRMFNVFGNAIDQKPFDPNVVRKSVHQPPPAFAKISTKSEIFETGIKAIDVLMPLEKGGKAGLLAVRALVKLFCLPK